MTLANRCLAGVLSAFLALTTIGCAHDTTMGQKFDDTTVTTKVKTALLADPDVKGMAIQVETLQGQVQLSGFVHSQNAINRAVVLARGIDGVAGVTNRMQLK